MKNIRLILLGSSLFLFTFSTSATEIKDSSHNDYSETDILNKLSENKGSTAPAEKRTKKKQSDNEISIVITDKKTVNELNENSISTVTVEKKSEKEQNETDFYSKPETASEAAPATESKNTSATEVKEYPENDVQSTQLVIHKKRVPKKETTENKNETSSSGWIIIILTILNLLVAGTVLYLLWSFRESLDNIRKLCKENSQKKDFDELKKQKSAAEEKANRLTEELNQTQRQIFTLENECQELKENEEKKIQEVESKYHDEMQKYSGEINRLEDLCEEHREQLKQKEKEYKVCWDAWQTEKNSRENIQKSMTELIHSFGENSYQIKEKLPKDSVINIIVFGLSKIEAMRDNKINMQRILKEFQYLDNQIASLIADDQLLQELRDTIHPFLSNVLDDYEIIWPAVDSNIAEYKNNELDLDSSSSGTTIKRAKCAAIYIKGDEDPFQKSIVECK